MYMNYIFTLISVLLKKTIDIKMSLPLATEDRFLDRVSCNKYHSR